MPGRNNNNGNNPAAKAAMAGKPPPHNPAAGGVGLGMNLKDTMFNAEMANVGRELVKTGDRPSDLLMRTHFFSANQWAAYMALLGKCDRFGLKEEAQWLKDCAAGLVSIGGEGRDQLVQFGTMTLRQTQSRHGFSLFGRGRKEAGNNEP